MKMIADNLRITKKKISDALAARDPEPVQDLVQQCVDENPWGVDVNTGPLKKDPEGSMNFFIQAVRKKTDLPLFIDTSNPTAMAVGLKSAGPGAVINGFSLEPAKLSAILPLAKEFDADIVGFLLYPDSSVPQTSQERFNIALDLVAEMNRLGISEEKLIIDPVIPPLAWENGIIQARSALETIRSLPDVLGFPVRTIAGISNLATRAPDRGKKDLITQSYVAMLAQAGLTFALIDILDTNLIRAARTASILTHEDIFSWAMVP